MFVFLDTPLLQQIVVTNVGLCCCCLDLMWCFAQAFKTFFILQKEVCADLNFQWPKPLYLPLTVIPYLRMLSYSGPPCLKGVVCELIFLLSKKIGEKVNSSTTVKCIKCVNSFSALIFSLFRLS